MKKNILVYGIIAGAIVSVLMLSMVNYMSHCEGTVNYDTSMVIGYASMIIALSLVFVGIRNYRNRYNNGVISFGKAFKIGMLIVLIASTIYVIAWLIYFYLFNNTFMDQYAANQLEELKSGGASQGEIEKKSKELAEFGRMYKNPFFNAMMTYLEILPVGLIITVVSSLLLKRKSPVKVKQVEF